MAQLWTNFGQAPGYNELDELAQRLADRIEVETTNYTDNWRCHKCGCKCEPVRCLLVTLPAFKCSFCKEDVMNPTTYAWKITDTVVNGWSLDFPVYDQERTELCPLFAGVGAVDCARKIVPAIHGTLDPAPFDMRGLLGAYKAYTNAELKHIVYEDNDSMPTVLTYFQLNGIPYNRRTEYDEEDPNEERLKISGYFRVPNDSLDLMRRLLGSGHPLLTFIAVGHLFRFVKGKEVYFTPSPGERNPTHSIVLIGCGVADRNGKAEVYFFARNSHGLQVHPDHQKHGYGGDFCVWASDIRNVWGFRL